MLKFFRIFAILLFLMLIIEGCGSSSNITTTTTTTSISSDIDPVFCIIINVLSPIPISCFSESTPECTSNYVYDNLINKGLSWDVVDPKEDQNNTPFPAQITFTSHVQKQVGLTYGGSVTVSAGVDYIVTASVKGQINHSVTESVTTGTDNSVTVSIPRGQIVYANYGVRVQVTSGHLYDKAGCEGSRSDQGTVITYAPIRNGWCVWTSGMVPCPSI